VTDRKPCPFCDDTFSRTDAVTRHIQRKHADDSGDEPVVDGAPILCRAGEIREADRVVLWNQELRVVLAVERPEPDRIRLYLGPGFSVEMPTSTPVRCVPAT
jgi:hypothetical protein